MTESPVLLLLLLIPTVPGVYILTLAVREFRSAYQVQATEPIPVADIDNRDSSVVVEGSAVPVSRLQTVRGPFTEKEYLAYTYETHEKIDVRNSGDSFGSGNKQTEDEWMILDDGRSATEFFVEDETGRILVDPSEADLRFETETYEPVPWRETPDPLAEYIQSTAVVDRQDFGSFVQWLKTPAVRFLEGGLEPGETVYVEGTVESHRVDQGTESIAAIAIGDSSRKGLSWRRMKSGLLYLGMGLSFFFAAGVIALGNL